MAVSPASGPASASFASVRLVLTRFAICFVIFSAAFQYLFHGSFLENLRFPVP